MMLLEMPAHYQAFLAIGIFGFHCIMELVNVTVF